MLCTNKFLKKRYVIVILDYLAPIKRSVNYWRFNYRGTYHSCFCL